MAPDAFAVAAEERGYHSLYLPEHTHLPVGSEPAVARRRGPSRGLPAHPRSVHGPGGGGGGDRPYPSRHRDRPGRPARSDRPGQADRHRRPICRGVVSSWEWGTAGTARRRPTTAWTSPTGAPSLGRRSCACTPCGRRTKPSYDGRWVTLPPSYSWPKPVQRPRVRTLVGGGAGPKLFAAVAEYADGWMPIGGAGVAVVAGRAPAGVRDGRSRSRLRCTSSPSGPCPPRASWTTTPRSGSPRWSSAFRRATPTRCAVCSTTTPASSHPPDAGPRRRRPADGPRRGTENDRRRGNLAAHHQGRTRGHASKTDIRTRPDGDHGGGGGRLWQLRRRRPVPQRANRVVPRPRPRPRRRSRQSRCRRRPGLGG